MSVILFTIALLFCTAGPAAAHSPIAADPQEQISGLLSLVLLLVFWAIYLIGVKQKPPRPSLNILFHAALVLCLFAVLGPLDDWAATSAAAHMTQHMMFMVLIAPLWVLSRPLPQLIAGGGRLSLWVSKPLLHLTHYPMATAYLHGAVIWFWHIPYFYNRALENPWWHIIEHACFLITAGLFWWAVLKSNQPRAPWALLAVLLTLMHTGFLGAMLTFAHSPLYGEARDLADQQLAGLIMWVAGGIPYLMASVWIAYRWYLQLQRRIDLA